jgi:hypothetical protein
MQETYVSSAEPVVMAVPPWAPLSVLPESLVASSACRRSPGEKLVRAPLPPSRPPGLVITVQSRARSAVNPADSAGITKKRNDGPL